MDDSDAVQDLLLAARFSHLEREVVKGLPVPGRIATLARGLREIRSSVRTIANRAMRDTPVVMPVGSAHPSVRAVASAKPRQPGKAALATKGRADAESAALIHGAGAPAWDINDSTCTGIMHASGVALPDAMEVAQDLVEADANSLRRTFIAEPEATHVPAEFGAGHSGD